MAVDDSHVYWANQFGNTIGRANLDGSGANHSFITGADLPCGVAVDGGHVYWANGGGTTIGSANLDGSGADQSFTAAKFPCGVAVSGSHIYWANYGLDVSGTTIGRAKLNGSDADQRFITGASDPCGVAVDGSHIYWANQTDNAIGRAKLNGRGVDQRFARANLPCGVAVDPFSFGKVTKDEKRGTAQLTVSIPGPGGLELAATEKLKGAAKRAEAAGEVKLPIKPKANAKRTLRKRGEAKVNVDVTYTPDGGEPRTESTSLRLVKR